MQGRSARLTPPAPGAWCSFFESEFRPPQNAPVARFQGLGCYQSGSEKTGFAALADAKAGLRRLCAECALGMPRMRPASRAHHSFFESEFKAPKTPLSHGFAGLVAIKARAEKACFWAYPALERQTKRGLKRPLPCGLAGWAAIAAVAHEKAACKRAPLAAGLRRLRLERALRAPRTHSEPRTRLGHAPDVLRKPRDSLFF